MVGADNVSIVFRFTESWVCAGVTHTGGCVARQGLVRFVFYPEC